MPRRAANRDVEEPCPETGRIRDVFGTLYQILGEDRLLRFVERFGGSRVYIPTFVKDDSPIAVALGRQAASDLATRLGPVHLYIPASKAWRIRIYHARGDSHSKIARAAGCSEAQVYRTLGAMGLLRRQQQVPGSVRGGLGAPDAVPTSASALVMP